MEDKKRLSSDSIGGGKAPELDIILRRYQRFANIAVIPAAVMGVKTTVHAGWILFRGGDFLSGMLFLMSAMLLLAGAFIVRTAEPSRAFRGIAAAAAGAAGALLLLALGKVWPREGLFHLFPLGIAYLSGPGALVWAYCATSALRAYEEGERSPQALARAPKTTFITVERSITYVVEVGLLVVFIVLLNWTKAQPGRFKRLDWTSLKPGERVFALSPKTREVLSRLDEDVHVIVFMTPPATADQSSIYEDVKELLTRFSARSRRIKVEYIDLHRQLTRAQVLVQKYRLNMAEAVDIESGVGGLVVFVSGDRQKYVHSHDMADFDLQQDPYGGYTQEVRSFKAEEAFLNALLTVTETAQLRVCFTQGHGEAGIDDSQEFGYLYTREMLNREGMIVDTLKKLDEQVPRRCDVVVIAGARVRFSEREAASLQRYLEGGGKLFYAAAQVEAIGSSVRFVRTGLEEVLENFGIRIEDAFALDLSLRAVQTPLIWIPEKTWGNHPITNVMDGKRLVLEVPRVVSAVSADGWTSVPLLTTTSHKDAWGETDLSFASDPRAFPKYDENIDIPPPVSVAVAAEQDKSGGARVVVFGTFQNFTNRFMDPHMPMQDFSADFLLNILNWLGEQEAMISLRPRTPERIKLELRADQVNRIFRFTVFGMPFAAMLLGMLVWWVRKN